MENFVECLHGFILFVVVGYVACKFLAFIKQALSLRTAFITAAFAIIAGHMTMVTNPADFYQAFLSACCFLGIILGYWLGIKKRIPTN